MCTKPHKLKEIAGEGRACAPVALTQHMCLRARECLCPSFIKRLRPWPWRPPGRLGWSVGMEQSPADARAAPSASGPTDMATETLPSPKRPRDPSSGSKVSQRATTFDPVWPEKKKKIFRRKRYTLAATRRDTSVHYRPVTPPPLSHSSTIPSPYSGRLLRGDGFRAACTTTTWKKVMRV
eukprot:scaffold459_cov117-Isochrysis_galbana.AAC.2